MQITSRIDTEIIHIVEDPLKGEEEVVGDIFPSTGSIVVVVVVIVIIIGNAIDIVIAG